MTGCLAAWGGNPRMLTPAGGPSGDRSALGPFWMARGCWLTPTQGAQHGSLQSEVCRLLGGGKESPRPTG